jgi:hypothetical protein
VDVIDDNPVCWGNAEEPNGASKVLGGGEHVGEGGVGVGDGVDIESDGVGEVGGFKGLLGISGIGGNEVGGVKEFDGGVLQQGF